jgi:hypothetical protein
MSSLALNGAGVEILLQLLHHDAFVRRVHIDEDQPGPVLRQDVDAVELRERVAERRGPLCSRQGNRKRRGRERLVGRRGLRQPERRLDRPDMRNGGVRDRRCCGARREHAL